MINDKLMIIKTNPSAAKHAAYRRRRKENNTCVNDIMKNTMTF